MSIVTQTNADNWAVRVTNPNGQASNTFGFQVVAPVVAPVITGVSPNPVTGSNSAQTVTINGTGFVNKPTVFVTWTGNSATIAATGVTFLSSTQLQMSIVTQANADNWTVRVTNPNGQASNTFGFQVVAPVVAPVITGVSPNPVTGSNSAQTVTINGTGFVNKPTVFVTWTGNSATIAATGVTFLSSTQLQMSIVTQTNADNWTVTVTNPNGQASNTYGFQVVAPAGGAPVITGVSPNPVTGSNSAQTVTINGTGFVNKPTVFVTWTGNSTTIAAAGVTFISSTQLQMSIVTQTNADNWTVTVTNPSGQASNTYGFQVVAPATGAPVITSVSPNPVTGSASSQTMTINGTGFVSKPSVFVTWTGGSATIATTGVTFLNATQLQISINVGVTADNWTIKVTNPSGQVSNTFGFQVVAPAAGAPVITSVSPNPVTGSNSAQTVTINGTGFVNKPTVFVTWTGNSATIAATGVTFLSSTQLQMSIVTQTNADNWTVTVTNPNGKASNTFGFQVVAPAAGAPVITSVSPNPVTGSNSAQTVTINGTGFVNAPTVFVAWTSNSATLPADRGDLPEQHAATDVDRHPDQCGQLDGDGYQPERQGVQHVRLPGGGWRGKLFGVGFAGQPDGYAGQLDDLCGDGAESERLHRAGESYGAEPSGQPGAGGDRVHPLDGNASGERNRPIDADHRHQRRHPHRNLRDDRAGGQRRRHAYLTGLIDSQRWCRAAIVAGRDSVNRPDSFDWADCEFHRQRLRGWPARQRR